VCGNWLAANVVNVVKLQLFAKTRGLPVLRWRLPPYTYANGLNTEMAAALSNENANGYPSLWGYFVAGMPVRVLQNTSLRARVLNGSRGTATSIRPRSAEDIRALFDNATWSPGDVVTIEQPVAIVIHVPTAIGAMRDVTFLTDDHHVRRRKEEVKVTSSISGGRKMKISIINSGYSPFFAGNPYPFQGQTEDKLIVDLNPTKYTAFDMHVINVVLSRVKRTMHMRLMPLSPGTVEALCALQYSEVYRRWEHAYDDNGVFVASRIPASEKLVTKKAKPSITRTTPFAKPKGVPQQSLTTEHQQKTSTTPAQKHITAQVDTPSRTAARSDPPVHASTTSSPVCVVPPTSDDFLQCFLMRASMKSHNALFQLILAKAFGCEICANNVTLNVAQIFYDGGYALADDCCLLRNCFQRLPDNTYETIRCAVGWNTRWDPCPSSSTLQLLLLGTPFPADVECPRVFANFGRLLASNTNGSDVKLALETIQLIGFRVVASVICMAKSLQQFVSLNEGKTVQFTDAMRILNGEPLAPRLTRAQSVYVRNLTMSENLESFRAQYALVPVLPSLDDLFRTCPPPPNRIPDTYFSDSAVIGFPWWYNSCALDALFVLFVFMYKSRLTQQNKYLLALDLSALAFILQQMEKGLLTLRNAKAWLYDVMQFESLYNGIYTDCMSVLHHLTVGGCKDGDRTCSNNNFLHCVYTFNRTCPNNCQEPDVVSTSRYSFNFHAYVDHRIPEKACALASDYGLPAQTVMPLQFLIDATVLLCRGAGRNRKCGVCHTKFNLIETHFESPPVLIVEMQHPAFRYEQFNYRRPSYQELTFTVGNKNYDLVGVVYHENNGHWIARLLQLHPSGAPTLWHNDGMVLNGHALKITPPLLHSPHRTCTAHFTSEPSTWFPLQYVMCRDGVRLEGKACVALYVQR